MKVKKQYLFIGSFDELKEGETSHCVVVDEDFVNSLSLSDLEGAAFVPLECAVTAESHDGVLKRVMYGRDLVNHYFLERNISDGQL